MFWFNLIFTFQDEVLKVKEDDTKFEVSVDTHGYKPEDLQVRIKDNMVTIEAKNEEKKEETNSKSYSAKHFSRSFTLPQGCKAQSVTSNLSKDGLLLVTAPKTEAVTHQPSRNVPISMKKYWRWGKNWLKALKMSFPEVLSWSLTISNYVVNIGK